MKEIQVSDCTKENLEELKMELYGAELETDTFLLLLTDELMDK